MAAEVLALDDSLECRMGLIDNQFQNCIELGVLMAAEVLQLLKVDEENNTYFSEIFQNVGRAPQIWIFAKQAGHF